jgi:hypothetical protein
MSHHQPALACRDIDRFHSICAHERNYNLVESCPTTGSFGDTECKRALAALTDGSLAFSPGSATVRMPKPVTVFGRGELE